MFHYKIQANGVEGFRRNIFVACLAVLGAMTLPAVNGQEAAADQNTAAVTQAEIIRRQELVFRATQAISDGIKAESVGDLAKAQGNYQFALDNLPPSPSTDAAIQKARSGIVRVSLQIFESAKKNGDSPKAVAALEIAAKYDPSNQVVQHDIAVIHETQKNPKKGDVLGNPAVTPEFVDDIHATDKLLVEGEQFRRTGQFDEAEARYKKVLTIDPYNNKAAEGLSAIALARQDYARVAQLATREERLRQVEEKWNVKPRRDITGSTSLVTSKPFTRSNNFGIDQKLKTFILKELVLTDASIDDAANALALRSKQLDPDPSKLGINFIVKPEAASSARPFSLNLRNIPMDDALRYIAKLANVKYKIQEYAVEIVPINASTEVVLSRTFNVPPSFFPPPSITATDTATGGTSRRPPPVVMASASTSSTNDVKSQLEERGVDFKTPGSGAVYYPGSGILQVRNTQEQLDLIEELVNAGATTTYMVDVAVKLVEIAQTDLNELTANSSFNLQAGAASVPVDVNGVPNGQFSAKTNLRGSSGFNISNLDALLFSNGSGQSTTVTPNTFTIQGQINHNIFSMVLNALEQKKSFDLLSAPSLRVKNGEDATINISRTFFYPTAFDPAESASVQNLRNSSSYVAVGPPIVIPTFPTEFETRDIGVKMKVRPQLGADNRTVDLALFPEVTDFEGFINYGSPIYVTGGGIDAGVDPLVSPNELGTGNAYLLSNNVLNQPVFNTRRIDTKVLVRDGYTVVLGGLMRDDVQTITDKVPFLGDLPLVGRLFQSKATQSQKKNLLIFVTCRVYLNNGELLNQPESNQGAPGVASSR